LRGEYVRQGKNRFEASNAVAKLSDAEVRAALDRAVADKDKTEERDRARGEASELDSRCEVVAVELEYLEEELERERDQAEARVRLEARIAEMRRRHRELCEQYTRACKRARALDEELEAE
jgi:hypothetical protein